MVVSCLLCVYCNDRRSFHRVLCVVHSRKQIKQPTTRSALIIASCIDYLEKDYGGKLFAMCIL